MSKTIDERVVQMEFDNKQFEKNVSTTMSTLDKLKRSLKLDGASKGLENVREAAKKVDLTPIGSGVEAVRVKFSALEVMAVTALSNITNSALNAGKKIVSALTIDPILTGFQEYETQMNAVQTILANTQSKGSTLSDVTAALDELNTYADQTIYNFTEMTRNIGTFTAAGVDLDKAVTSIKGIANLAAVSGSNAQQASTAMYQLSQALAAGKVSLMDWNSVVNAGMGGELFQNALKRTATQMGHNVDALIKKYGSFRESLTQGNWLTAEVLTETLTQLSGAYSEADLIAQGYNEKQAKEIVELANTAVGAATNVKTFTQLWDTMKESAQSGWAKTWQIILGDFEEAKAFFTELSNIFGPIIQSISDARNNLLEGALGSKWTQLTKQINEAGVATDDFNAELEKTVKDHGKNIDQIIKEYGSLEKAFSEGALSSDLIVETLKRMAGVSGDASKATEDMTDKLEYFQKVVSDVWRGDYQNGEERIKALTDAGYDYAQVQSLVNKTVDGHKLTLEDLTDVQLKSIGYTDEEVSKLRELAKQAEETGTPLNQLINDLNKPSGRDLLLDSVLNVIHSIIDSAGAVRKAWQEIFPPMQSTQLYNIIEGINALTEKLKVNEKTVDKITRTFKGLFAILDIITTIIGGGFKVGLKILSTLLGAVDLNLLDLTALLGDAAVGFRNFLLDNQLINKGIEVLVSGLKSLASSMKRWYEAFISLPFVQKAITNFINRLNELKEVGQNAIEGLKNGLQEGLYSIPQLLMKLGQMILDAIKGVLGIHSPSTEMHEVGVNTMDGLLQGIKSGFSALVSFIKGIGSTIVNIISNIPWSSIIAAGVSVGLLLTVKNLVGAIGALTAPLEGLGDMLSGVGKVLNKAARPIAKTIKGFANVLNSYALSIKANALKSIAIAIALLAGSVFLLAQLDTAKLWSAIGALAALAAIIGLLSAAVGKWGPKEAMSFSGFALAVVGISASLLLMSVALKKIASIDPGQANQALIGFVTIVASLALILATYGQLVKGKASQNINKVGAMMLKLSVSLLLMVAVIKLLSGMSSKDILKGGIAITAFAGIITLLSWITKFAGKNADKLGSMMIRMSVSMFLLIGVIKLISGLSVAEIVKGVAAITAFVGIFAALALITNFGNKEITKLGRTLISMSASMLLMVAVIKLVSGISVGDILKGITTISAFTGIIAAMALIVKKVGKDAPKISATILAMSASIAIMAGVAILLSLIDLKGLAKGITAVGLLGAVMSMMVQATRRTRDVKGNLIVMTVAIGIMATAVAALSFIDPARLAGATLALGTLMGMFALIIKSASNIKSSIGTLIVMETAIVVLGGVIYALSGLPVESVLGTAAALSVLLLSLSGSLFIIKSVGSIAPSTLATLGVMTLAVAAMAAIIGVLAYMDVGPTLEIAASLSLLLTALSTACLILAAVGMVGAGAALQGALALDGVIIVVGGLMAGIGALATYFPQLETFLDTGIGLLEKIGYGLGSFFGNIIGGFSAGVTSGLPAIGQSLSDFMANLQPFLVGMKSIDPSIMDGVKTLAQTILILSGANLVESLTSWLTGGSSLSSFAAELVPFGMSMAAFSAVMSGRVNPDLVVAAATAGKALAEMAATLPNSGGVLGFFTGENDMNEFGNQLIPFGEAMTGFSNAVTGLKPELVQQAATAGKAIAEMAATLPNSGGVLGFFAGENDMEMFASQLIPFGEAMTGFSLAVVDLKADAVEKAAIAGKSIAELASSLPNSGGVWGFFAGENDMEMFGSQLVPFGKAMTDFSLAVVDLKPESIEKAQIAGKSLVELASTIPNTGGLVDFFTGSNDLSMFGTRLVDFGDKFKQYSDYMVNVDSGIVTATTNAASSIVELQKSLPKEGGWFSDDATLADFGSDMASFGEKFAAYYEKISGINASTLSAVITQTNRLVEMAKGISGIDFSSVSSFSVALTNLGNAGIESFISAFTNAGPRVSQAATTMLTTFTTAANGQKGSMTTTFTSIVDGIIIAIQGKTASFNIAGQSIMTQFILGINLKKPEVQSSFSLLIASVLTTIRNKYGEFETVGTMLIVKLIGGIKSKEESLKTSFTTSLSSALTSIRGQYSSFYDAGRYLVEGFTAGINDNVSLAASAAASMAHSAYTSAMNALNAASPSKLFMKVGSYVPLGFAIGISSEKSAIEKSTDSMAQTALDSTKNAIAKVADAINSDMDTQPTIRPVLDLTDVETKAGRLNTLFSRNRALSIESSMNHPSTPENQNGAQTGSSGSVFSFTQNNYSPKALSRVEIYRQTKNQFSQMERMVKA